MANTIKHKRGSGSNPGTSDLSVGELAIRTDTAKLFTKNDAGSVVEIGSGISNLVEDTSPQLGGDLQSNGNDIDFADNDKAIFGTGGDLQIYHDGLNSRIEDSGTGRLFISSDLTQFLNAAKTETTAEFIENGAVNLYYDNSKKFETLSSGAAVTGNLNILNSANTTLKLFDSSGDPDSYGFLLYNNGNDADDVLILGVDGDNEQASSHIRFYVDGTSSSAEKFRVNSSGAVVTGSLGIGTSSPDVKLDVARLGNAWTGQDPVAGTAAHFHNGNNSSSSPAYLGLGAGTASISGINFGDADDADVGRIHYSHSDNSLTFGTDGAAERMRIDSSGNVGIGTSSPAKALEVVSNTVAQIQCGMANDSNRASLMHNGSHLFLDTTAGDLVFRGASNAERMRIDSSGRLLVGTTTEGVANASEFTIADTGHCGMTIRSGTSHDGQIAFSDGTSGDAEFRGQILYNHADNYMRFSTNAVERARIASAGGFSIGRAGDPRAFNHASSGVTTTMLEVRASDSSNSIFESATFRGGADHNGAGARVRLVHSGDRGLVLVGGRTSNAAFGSIGLTDQNGGITSSVHINSAGTWFWNKSSQSSGTAGVELYKDGPNFITRNDVNALGINCQSNSTGDSMRFYFQDVHRGSLNYNGSTFQTVTHSDYRLKENNTPIIDGIARLKKLNPIRFNWKRDPEKTYDGFVAHEVQDIVPEAVVGEKDAPINEKGEGYQMMNNEPLIPLLTAALKEAVSKIELLESKVAVLEAG